MTEDRPTPMTPQLIMGLTGQVDELIGRLDVMEERRRLDRRTWLTGIGVIAALVLLAAVTGVASVYTSAQNAQTLGIVQDCAQEGGECYQRGRDRSANIVDILRDHQLAVVMCARRYPGAAAEQQFMACVELETRDMEPVR